MFEPFGLCLAIVALLVVYFSDGVDDRRLWGKTLGVIGGALILSPLVIVPTLIMVAVGWLLVQLLSSAGL